LGAALRRAWVGYRRLLEAELGAAGFTATFPDARVLRICSRQPDATIADIGRELAISRQGAAKIVSGLRERGYVVLQPSPTSGREKLLVLTPEARAYLRAQRRAARRIESRLAREVGPDGLAALHRLLEVLEGDDQPGLLEYLSRRGVELPEPVD
jgi:DNA-binding MarR family transcriptional regulator